jgi:sulfite oxidase
LLNPFRSKPAHATIANEALLVHSNEPFNAEPPLDRLRAAFVTPQHLLYVRSHGPVPVLPAEDYHLVVEGQVATPLKLSLTDLKSRFAEVTVAATLQCAGNRRADMQRVRPTSGDPWAPGAIGNAAWTGVSLAEVLRAAGAEPDPALHVAFESADECDMKGKSFLYGASIPMHKAMTVDVLLATQMNGEPLTPEHGAPLRIVVPGYAGVRSPKWLRTITVQDKPSDNPIQADDYKLFPSDITAATADPAKGMTINALPLNSAICEPARHAVLKAGPTILRGYATASNRKVVRVDISADGGRTWTQAALEDKPDQPWSWVFWHATLDMPKGEHELAVRAWDEAGQTQPALPDDTWNYRGYLSAAWHRISVVIT